MGINTANNEHVTLQHTFTRGLSGLAIVNMVERPIGKSH